MLQAKDLQIGDWVYVPHNGNATHYGKVVSLLSSGTVEVELLDGGTALLSSVEPIPLTPEILEKNGFEWGYTTSEEDFCGAAGCNYPEDKGWCYDEGAGEIKIIFPNDSDGGLIRLDDQCGDRHLEIIFVNPIMVHQLQHALSLCGIEKEIKL